LLFAGGAEQRFDRGDQFEPSVEPLRLVRVALERARDRELLDVQSLGSGTVGA
jgi:hypothetical protein